MQEKEVEDFNRADDTWGVGHVLEIDSLPQSPLFVDCLYLEHPLSMPSLPAMLRGLS